MLGTFFRSICRLKRRFWGASLAVSALVVASCSKEELNDLVEKGKQQVEQASQGVTEKTKQLAGQAAQTGEQAKQQLGQAGEMQLNLDAAVQTSGCYATYVPPQGGRPGVLQLRSYAKPDTEAFPSVLVRLTSTAENVAGLRDQSLAGQVFVQKEKGGPVWQSDANAPLQLKVTQADEKAFVADVTGGSLRSFPDGKSSNIHGRLNAVWQ